MKKYELTEKTLEWFGRTLHRIRACKDFETINGTKVKKGDLGGFIEKEDNLSQQGRSWVGDNAKVYGNAQVYDDALVCGYAQVCEDALVCGYALVCDNAQVYGNVYTEGM